MKVIAVDDEKLALDGTLDVLEKMECVSEYAGFTDPRKAKEYFVEQGADVALLDIEIGKYSGLALAKELKDIKPDVRIVFITGYPQYASDAFRLHASGYIIKPFDEKDIRAEFDALLNPLPPLSEKSAKRVRIQCFGNFEVFVDGIPLSVSRRKSKELLAYLVDRRGAGATMSEIASALWEDGEYDDSRNKQIHNYLSDLIKSLEAAGAADIILRQRNSLAVDKEKVDCDFYSCISGDPAAINSYTGEYMAQYSWAELTTGALTMKYI